MKRRDFLAQTAAGAAVAAGLSASSAFAAQEGGMKKAVVYSMLPSALPPAERFKLARECGFDGIEMPPVPEAECEALRSAAEKAGVRLHSVIYGGWNPPLTHPDAAQREQSVKLAEAALRSAKALGSDCILLVPGVVNAQTPYGSAYQWAQEGIRKLIPTAERLRVPILIEEVWNNFLLSPLEFNRFVDSFQSPWVQAYFDVGNVVPFGWPQDWIRTLGPRIKKVHLKDFKGGPGLFQAIKGDFVNLRDGSIDWPEVRKALGEIGYNGWVTCELGGGDADYLKDVNRRVDLILAGK
ncbi:MAG: sugar phosphate isomerase/epimerase family protein [Armatimonadota bacterium]